MNTHIYEIEGYQIHANELVNEDKKIKTTLFCNIEPGAYRSVSFATEPGLDKAPMIDVFLQILLFAIKQHFKQKGKVKAYTLENAPEFEPGLYAYCLLKDQWKWRKLAP